MATTQKYPVLLSGGPAKQQYRLELTVGQASQNISGNSSVPFYSLTITKLSGTGYSSGYTSTWTVNIGGLTASGSLSSYSFTGSTTSITLKGTTNLSAIAHNADGTKTINVSATFNDGGPNGAIGSGTASGTFTFDTIARESSFGTISGSTLGSAVTVNLTRAASTYTHDAWYSFGNSGWVSIGTGYGTSFTFTPPSNLASKIPNNTSGVMTFRILTKQGTTNIGTYVTKAHTMNVPTTMVPTAGTLSASIVAANATGTYVQGLSSVNLSLAGHAGVEGSTISSVTISGPGFTINGTSGVSGVINASGNVVITARVVDSRGRVANATVTLNFLAYNSPSLSVSAVRSDSTGNLSSTGTAVKYTYKVTVASLLASNVQKNGIAKIEFYNGGTAASKTLEFPTVLTRESSEVITGTPSTGYDAKLVVTDKMGTTATWTTRIPAGTVALDIGDDNVGVGKFWERGTIDAAGPIYQNNGQVVVSSFASSEASLNDLTYESFTGSVNVTDTSGPEGTGWYWVINTLHRGGSGDGSNYGLQIVNKNSSDRVYTRSRSNGVWLSWKRINSEVMSNIVVKHNGNTNYTTTSGGAKVAIPLATLQHYEDPMGNFTRTNTRITCNRAGTVKITLNAVWRTETAVGYVVPAVQRNTVELGRSVIQTWANAYGQGVTGVTTKVLAGQYFEFFLELQIAGTVNIYQSTHVSIEYLNYD